MTAEREPAGLPAFLLACIAEDEAVAEATLTDPIATWAQQDWIELDDAALTHVHRWEPARVLADCEARRRVVGLHNDDETPTICPVCHWQAGYDMLNELAPCQTLRLLALPYAGHPDYQAEWRPDTHR